MLSLLKDPSRNRRAESNVALFVRSVEPPTVSDKYMSARKNAKIIHCCCNLDVKVV